MHNKEITYKERCQIEALLKEKISLRQIANNLNKGKSTIADEVSRNGGRKNYVAEKAQRRRYWKRYRAKRGCSKIALDRHIHSFVEKGLSSGCSPETISKRLKTQSGIKYTSGKSIRKFVKTRPNLERYLFWERNNKKGGIKKNKKGNKLENRKFIELRPDTACVYGHWEGDFIVSRHNSWVLLVLVEKLTKLVILRLLPNRNNNLVNEAIISMLNGYTVKSLTLDNDIAFQAHKGLEERIKAPIYFCHPYHSWEKGLVENINRWIRVFVPKKTNLALLRGRDLEDIENWLNYNPRQCLQGYSSYEKMMEYQHKQTQFSTLFVKLPRTVRIGG